jgi:DNA processing protein
LVISEYPPGTAPARHRFAARARLLACLGGGTVVVEAGPRSGARAVATHAAALGRSVMAVPGPITSAMSSGCHQLLRSGTAVPVTDLAEILQSTGLPPRDRVPHPDPVSA